MIFMEEPQSGSEMDRRTFLRKAGAVTAGALAAGALGSAANAAPRPKKLEKRGEKLGGTIDSLVLHNWVKEFRKRLSPADERKLQCSLSSQLSFTNPQGAPDISFVISGERFTSIILGRIEKFEILRLPKQELDRLKTMTETPELRKEFEEKLMRALVEKGLYRE